jgi:hypothetical protein
MRIDEDGIVRFTSEEEARLGNTDGFVLIQHRTGFKSTYVHGRYSATAADRAKARLEEDPDTVSVEIVDARLFQDREDLEHRSRRLFNDWGLCNVLNWPLIED